LANSVPRASVVLAKLAAGILTLCVPLGLAFTLSLLVLVANPDIVLNGEHWSRLALYFLLSSLFLAQIYSLSLLVSAAARRPAVSLVICLFAWLVGGVGYANVLPALIRYSVDEPPHHIFVEQQRRENDVFSEEMGRWYNENPSPDGMYQHGIWEDNRFRYGHPRYHQWLQRRFAHQMERALDLARRVGALRRASYAPLGDQARLVDRWAILSPLTSYGVLTKQLARTTLDDKDLLRDAGHRYRDTYIGWLRGRHAFGDRRWYSDDPGHQEPLVPDPESLEPDMLVDHAPYMQERLAWAREQSALADADPARRLDLSDMPKFGERWQRTLGGSVQAMTPGLVVLILTLGLSVTGTTALFVRSDLV
ncbi:ABC transporter permease, partial [Candidatus Latescibacterota bacterium]